MEKVADIWKRYPLLVIGGAPVPVPGAIELPLSGAGTPGSLPVHDFYLLVSAPGEELPCVLARLGQAQVPPEQIVALLGPDQCLPAGLLPWAGALEIVDGESPDEFRARLLGRLERQRQKKLNFALQETSDAGLARRLPEAELARVLDGTRIAHALACAYALSPLAHSLALRACREPAAITAGPWGAELGAERLIVLCAFLFLECQARGVSFRDQLKERSASLPFRARSELLHHIESGLGYLLGGKGHAA